MKQTIPMYNPNAIVPEGAEETKDVIIKEAWDGIMSEVRLLRYALLQCPGQ